MPQSVPDDRLARLADRAAEVSRSETMEATRRPAYGRVVWLGSHDDDGCGLRDVVAENRPCREERQ